MKKCLIALAAIAAMTSIASASELRPSSTIQNHDDQVVASFARAGLMPFGEIQDNSSGDDQIVASFERAGLYPPVSNEHAANGENTGDYNELVLASFERAGLIQPEAIVSREMVVVANCN